MTAPVALASLFALVEGESEDRKKERSDRTRKPQNSKTP